LEATFEYRERLADGSFRSFEVLTAHFGLTKNNEENFHDVLLGSALKEVPWYGELGGFEQGAVIRRCKQNLQCALMQWPNPPPNFLKVVPTKRVKFFM
jgi:hypothetical protein